jgi:trimeric autotransporter adhesin
MAGKGRTARTRSGRAAARISIAVVVGLGALLLAGNALAGGPAVRSDLADYAPGSTVTLTGTGWGVGESVHVTVDDTLGQTWAWLSNPDVLAGLDGSFTLSVTLPNAFIANYTVNAVGSSGAAATTSFTDGNATSVSGTVTDSVTHNPIAGATVTCDTSGGCNGTFSTTTSAAGAYVFSGGNKLTFATSGPVVLTLSVSKSGYGTGAIALSNVNNSDTLVNKNVALTPSQANQATLSVTGPVSATFGGADKAISTTGGSGNGAITFSAAASTACSISGSNLHVTSGTGSCSITATKEGDTSFSPTTSAPFDVTINKASQTLSFTSNPPSGATVGGIYQPAATGGASGNAVTFGATGACSYNGSTQLVTMTSVGTCTVAADQLGKADY